MDLMRLGIGPISDVTGFSHRDGATYLEALAEIKKKINELIASRNTDAGYVNALVDSWEAGFEAFQQAVTPNIDEHVRLIGICNDMINQMKEYVTQDTDYIVATIPVDPGDPGDPNATTNTDYRTVEG